VRTVSAVPLPSVATRIPLSKQLESGPDVRERRELREGVWRQIEALREDFPKLAQLLGDEGFCAAAEKYLRANPSTHASLERLGRHFAPYLAESPGAVCEALADRADAVKAALSAIASWFAEEWIAAPEET
jgi:hypothetical protein